MVMRISRSSKALVCGVLFLVMAVRGAMGQRVVGAPTDSDSDKDGLSDVLEQRLLEQFAPVFMVGQKDCSGVPAEFEAGVKAPTVQAENGTIYGQAFPAKSSTVDAPVVELHFYHLWRQDCGKHGHPLDTEHVAALVRRVWNEGAADRWKATYWYAAAHENTVCDVSQIARASTLHAEEHGAKVWISPGKHASYLNETLCEHGCGADRCEEMVTLPARKVINLGEVGHPMNGAVFIASNRWPLAEKMGASNFPPEALVRVDGLPATDIAWYRAGRHPTQGVIAVSSSTEGAIANGGHDTTTAISVAGNSTGDALSSSGQSTGNALQKSYHKTAHALGTSVRHVGDTLHVTSKPDGSANDTVK
jgi:hypothetical protein